MDKQTQIILEEKGKKEKKDSENPSGTSLPGEKEKPILKPELLDHNLPEREIDLSVASCSGDMVTTQTSGSNRSDATAPENNAKREESAGEENRISVINPDEIAYQTEIQTKDSEPEKESDLGVSQKTRSYPPKSKEKEPSLIETEEKKPNKTKTVQRRTGLKPPKSISQPVNMSKGVAYLSGNMIRLIGGVKLSPGDEIKIKDKEFVLRPQGKKHTLLYGIAAVAVFLGLILFTPLFKSNHNGKLIGVVLEENTRLFIPQAKIYLKETGTTIKTNQFGFFIFETLPPGLYTVETSYTGYQTKKENIAITKDQSATLSIQLSPLSSFGTSSDLSSSYGTSKAGGQNMASSDMSTDGSDFGAIRIKSNISDPVISIDHKPVGAGNKLYKKISAGTHTITATKEGYSVWAKEAQVQPGQTLNLEVELSLDKNYHAAPQTWSDYVSLGNSQIISNDFAQALNSFNQAISLKPDSPEALWGRGNAYLQSGDKTKALEDLDQAGRLFLYRQEYQSAVLCFNFLLTLNDKEPSYSLNRGICYLQLGQYQSSIPDLKKATGLDDGLFLGYLNLGEAYYRAGDYKLSIEAYKRARKLNPKNPEVYVGLTKVYTVKGDKSEAKKSYKKYQELSTYIDQEKLKQDPNWGEVLKEIEVEK